MTYHVHTIHVFIITLFVYISLFTLQRSCAQGLHALSPVIHSTTNNIQQDRLGIVVYYLLLPRVVSYTSSISIAHVKHHMQTHMIVDCQNIFIIVVEYNILSTIMELSDRVVQVRSTAKHGKDYPSFTQDDIVFLFGDVVRPVGLVSNKSDSLECFVIFPPPAPMHDVFDLPEQPSWVEASMQLGIHKPKSGMLTIVSKLLQDKDLEEGDEYEYIPIQPLDPEDHSTPKKKGGPAAPYLTHGLKHMPTQELQQLLSSLQHEIRTRQDASMGSAHDVSSVLQTLLKEGALRTNVPKLSAFSGEAANGEVSFDQ